MKKYICPVCGVEINPSTDEKTLCKECNTLIDNEILLKTNPLKVKKEEIITYAMNMEYKVILNLDYDDNELIFNYYKMYANLNLGNKYDVDSFFNKEFKYTTEEMDHVIKHMLEHNKLYDLGKIREYILKYGKDNDLYQNMFSQIINRMDERIIEKDLREKLFPNTKIPKGKKLYDSRKSEGSTIFILSLILIFVFTAIVFIFVDKELKYSFFNLSLIIPCIFLTNGISKMAFKKKNIILSILIFIVLYYFITMLYGFKYMNIETNIFFDHLKGIAYTPYELIKALIERGK